MKQDKFDERWKEAREFGCDIKGWTKELVESLERLGLPAPDIQGVIALFAEIDGYLDYLKDEYLEKEQFNAWLKQRYLVHFHAGEMNTKVSIHDTTKEA